MANARSYFPLYGTDGAADGFKKANTNMYIIYKHTSTNPGIKAPKNISPADVDVTSNVEGIESSPVVSLWSAFRILEPWSAADAN